MLITESNYLVKEYKLLEVKIIFTKSKKIINRNITFPVEIDVCDALVILQKTLPSFTILSFNEEKVLSVFYSDKIQNDQKYGLIDEYWIDGLQYLLEVENKNFFVVCEYELKKYELIAIIRSIFKIVNKVCIDELSECWILRDEYFY
ncbi:hypothetical protein [Enterococcus faecalis]|uniref:hypothetical protein n=1 Tax=Enterococcus faecalis TaxID=1351 RepID=UPI000354902C|nr:hypothetical protein [Enterococcus faecalis]EPI38515.1 hypothetical protein D348_00122 [Enterococcus faecalis SLO2C-1]MCH1672741.1 hypothetical protein [Enterococcus faecalis]MDM3980273.1 hypothetical protein [Enterococcus faecalis]NSN01531.1 hypothetical protein [Enterococcus faecalis]NSN40918.1 hypothetical protein [Enterococcus faecalis]